MENRQFLRRKDAAAYLQARYGAYTTETLAKLACVGGGPPFRKMGAFPLYTPAELDAWALEKMSAAVLHNGQLVSGDSK